MFFYNVSDRKYNQYFYIEQTSFSELKNNNNNDDEEYDGLLIYTYHTNNSSTSYILNKEYVIDVKKIENNDVELYDQLNNLNNITNEKIEIRRLKEINWTKPIIIIPLILETFMSKYTLLNDLQGLKNIILNIDETHCELEINEWSEKYKDIVCHDLVTHNDYFVNTQ